MCAKMGRPVIGKPKTIDLKIRLDEDMNNALVKYAKENNISRTEVIRRAVDMFLSK